MGIYGFHKWIREEYNSVYYNINESNKIFHHLYIDLNYLLHLCHYNCNDEKHLINKMSMVLLEICGKVCPVVSVNLFCDGTAPFAKMILQRERRNKTNLTDEIFKTSLNFTPGTQFIQNISNKLQKCINTIKIYFNVEVNVDSIFPGEAEIKIKNKLIQNYNKNKEHSHILVTNDADVVLILASDNTYTQTSILLRDTVLPMKELLEQHFGKWNINNLDFVLLNLLLGNDYIPKVGELSFKKIWNAYFQNITKNTYILNINNNVYDFNKNLLIDILNDCVGKIGRTKIIKNNKMCIDNTYKNYFDGVIWTLIMYNQGKCHDYNYICNSNKPIDILNLILYLYNCEIYFKYVNTHPIPSVLCGMLLLPENSVKYLIDAKYCEFIDKHIKNTYKSDFKLTLDFIRKTEKTFIDYEKNLYIE